MDEAHKPVIRNVVNSEHMLWLQLEPSEQAVYAVNSIITGVDDNTDGILAPNENITYRTFVTKRYSHFTNDGLYALTIFTPAAADFIIVKDHPSYAAIGTLLKKYFELTDEQVHVRVDGAQQQDIHQHTQHGTEAV